MKYEIIDRSKDAWWIDLDIPLDASLAKFLSILEEIRDTILKRAVEIYKKDKLKTRIYAKGKMPQWVLQELHRWVKFYPAELIIAK